RVLELDLRGDEWLPVVLVRGLEVRVVEHRVEDEDLGSGGLLGRRGGRRGGGGLLLLVVGRAPALAPALLRGQADEDEERGADEGRDLHGRRGDRGGRRFYAPGGAARRAASYAPLPPGVGRGPWGTAAARPKSDARARRITEAIPEPTSTS